MSELAERLLARVSPSAPFDMGRVRTGEVKPNGYGYPINDGIWLYAALAALAGEDDLASRYAQLLPEPSREHLEDFLDEWSER